jgi:hypothetical protein
MIHPGLTEAGYNLSRALARCRTSFQPLPSAEMTVGARHRQDADVTGETAAAFPQIPNRSSSPARHFKVAAFSVPAFALMFFS